MAWSVAAAAWGGIVRRAESACTIDAPMADAATAPRWARTVSSGSGDAAGRTEAATSPKANTIASGMAAANRVRKRLIRCGELELIRCGELEKEGVIHGRLQSKGVLPAVVRAPCVSTPPGAATRRITIKDLARRLVSRSPRTARRITSNPRDRQRRSVVRSGSTDGDGARCPS